MTILHKVHCRSWERRKGCPKEGGRLHGGVSLTLGVTEWQEFVRAVGKGIQGMSLEVVSSVWGLISRWPGEWYVHGRRRVEET